MNPEARDVYVPSGPPAEAIPERGPGDGMPGPVYTPGAEGRDRALAARVREALRLGGRPPAARDVAELFRAPATARAVVDRLAGRARDLGCSAVVAPGPGGGLIGAPVAVAARLPLVVVEGLFGTEGDPGRRGPDGGGAGAPDPGAAPLDDRLGADDRVLLVDDVADTGTRLAAASERVERTGARVAAVAVVVEADGGDARDRLDGRDLLSIIRL